MCVGMTQDNVWLRRERLQINARYQAIDNYLMQGVKILEQCAEVAASLNQIAEHDLIQIALTQIAEIKVTVERARASRSDDT